MNTRIKRFYERQKVKEPAFGDNLVLEDENKALMREAFFRNYMIRQYDATVLDNSSINIEILADKIYKTISKRDFDKEREEEK